MLPEEVRPFALPFFYLRVIGTILWLAVEFAVVIAFLAWAFTR